MAARERLTEARHEGGLPVLHLGIGLATLLFVIIQRPIEGDPLGVYSIADRLAQGLVAYRDFAIEYPPLALLHIYLPRLIGGPSEWAYEVVFTLFSICLTIGTGVAVYWLARHGWSASGARTSLLLFVSLSFAAIPVVVWRFDILPAFLTALALAAFVARRNAWSGLALGLGTAAKLYPAFLGPVLLGVLFFERRFRSAVALVVVAVATVGAIALQLYLVAGPDAFSYLLYQEERQVEIESVAGGLALLADALGIVGAKLFVGFGPWQVSSQVLTQLALPLRVFDVLVVLALLVTAAWRFRADVRATGSVAPLTVVAYVVATLLAVILTNKVLSPQYLVWLLPFAALMPQRQSLLLLVTLVLTTLIYPLAFQSLIQVHPLTVITLNVRNLLLLVLFVWVVWPQEASLGRVARRWRGERALA